MAVALDASTPVKTTIVKTATSATCPAFSPPATSMIVAFWGLQAADSVSVQSVTTMSNTGTALTWARKPLANHGGSAPGGSAEIWWAYNANAQTNITVTGNFTRPAGGSGDLNGGLLAVKVFTGTASSLASAASASAVGVTAGLPTCSLVTTGANSWVWGAALNWDTATLGTAGTNQTLVDTLTDAAAGDAEWTQKQNAVTASSGTSVTINDTAPSTHYLIAALEILAAAGTTFTATLTASGTGVSSITRQAKPVKAATGTGLVTRTKTIASTRSVTGTGVASITRFVSHPLSSVAGTGVVSISRTFSLALVASGTGVVPALVKQAKPQRRVVATGVPSISNRAVTTTKTVTGVGAVALVKGPRHALGAVTGTGVLSLTSLTIPASVGAALGFVRLYDLPVYAVALSDEAVNVVSLTDELAFAVGLSDQV